MRLLLLLIALGVGAYFTVPTREAHEAAARAYLQANPSSEQAGGDLSLDDVVSYVQGMMAGQGRYDSFYLGSKYSVDLPGAAYLECYGAFTVVRCSEVAPGSSAT